MIETIAQVLGYLASVLLAYSLLVTNDIRFRWLNSFGCLCFILYGLFIGAFPIVLTNTILLGINAFALIKIYRTQEKFDIVEFKPEDILIHKFLSFYKKDIDLYFPDYNINEPNDDLRFVVLRNLVIANIFVTQLSSNGKAIVKINYTVPKYRDYKVGRFIFEQERDFLHSKGVKEIVYEKIKNTQHERFLKVMGFEKELETGIFTKAVS